MGCVQSKELEGNGPFPLQSSPLNASLGKEDISDETGSQDKKSTSSEATDQHLLIHGPVELRNGCSRKKRHLFLLNNSLLISNTRYKKIFKIKYVIPLQTLWMDKVEDSHSGGKKSFLLGWPMENFRVTFPLGTSGWSGLLMKQVPDSRELESTGVVTVRNVKCHRPGGKKFDVPIIISSSLEQKEKWCSFLERNINLVKEEDQQKSLELQIFTKDIQHSPVAVTATSTDTVNDVIMKTLSILGKSGYEKEYLLSFDSGKEEAPFMLTGHECLYAIKMNHLGDKAFKTREPKKSTSLTLQDPFQEQVSPDFEGQFFLERRHAAKWKQGSKPTTNKRRCPFMNWISFQHSNTCHNNLCETPPPTRTEQLVRTSIMGIGADELGVDD